jgi:hypothetical protein
MKVGSTGSTSAPKRARKSGESQRTSSGGFADILGQVDAGAEAGLVDAPTSLTGVDSILAVQAINPDAGSAARQRMAQRGEDILDQLDDVRVQMLSGAIPKAKLTNLAQLVRSKREEGVDPRLSAILDEIELRAEVEIAKLSRR